jgi:hypothetical protein
MRLNKFRGKHLERRIINREVEKIDNIELHTLHSCCNGVGARGSVAVSGTMLQAERQRVRFPIR